MADVRVWAVVRKEEAGTYMTGFLYALEEWDCETDPPASYNPATDVLWERGAGAVPGNAEPGWTFVWSDTSDAATMVWTNPNPPPEE